MTSSVVEEVTISSAGNNRTCSDRRSRENECSNGEGTGIKDGGGPQKRFLCHGGR